MNTEESDAEWLLAHGNRLIAGINWPVDILSFVTQLRKHQSAARAHMLCELLELRSRAKAKFSRAAEMYFTRLGYEQATDELIANYKAERFSTEDDVVDLCCGIGGDAMGFAKHCKKVTLIDRDETAICFAAANLRAYGQDNYATRQASVNSLDLASFSAWHIDPDRRSGERREKRNTNPTFCDPPISEILNLQNRSPRGAIKLAPAANVQTLLAQNVELEWIGHDRGCQQQIAWFGDLAKHPGKITATVYSHQDSQWATHVENTTHRASVQPHAGLYLYEPCPSVIAAGLVDSLAEQLNQVRLASTAYLTSDNFITSPLITTFQILDDNTFHRDVLVKTLRGLDCRVESVKKRGVSLDPDALLRALPSEGATPVSVLLYQDQNSIRCAIGQRTVREL